MPVHPNVKVCTHIKVTGVRCGSPALRGEQFCYFHQNMVRGIKPSARPRLHPIAQIENEEAIQASLMEVINALLCGTIELKRAELILRALHIAVKNARRVKFGIDANHMVKEIPDYAVPAPPEEPRELTSEEVAQIRAAHLANRPVGTGAPASPGAPVHVGTGNVGTGAPARPGGPEVSGRSAVVATTPDPTSKKPPANVKEAPKERKDAAHGASRG